MMFHGTQFKCEMQVRNILPSAAEVEMEILIPNSLLSTQGVTLHVVELPSISVDVKNLKLSFFLTTYFFSHRIE